MRYFRVEVLTSSGPLPVAQHYEYEEAMESFRRTSDSTDRPVRLIEVIDTVIANDAISKSTD